MCSVDQGISKGNATNSEGSNCPFGVSSTSLLGCSEPLAIHGHIRKRESFRSRFAPMYVGRVDAAEKQLIFIEMLLSAFGQMV